VAGWPERRLLPPATSACPGEVDTSAFRSSFGQLSSNIHQAGNDIIIALDADDQLVFRNNSDKCVERERFLVCLSTLPEVMFGQIGSITLSIRTCPRIAGRSLGKQRMPPSTSPRARIASGHGLKGSARAYRVRITLHSHRHRGHAGAVGQCHLLPCANANKHLLSLDHSSERACRVAGMSMPSAPAVLRLFTNSTVVGCMTGGQQTCRP
jgi:hypothetical protein